ncbi:MAG: hypothetical protein ACOCWT_03635, partial [Desulfohalobiaceae bacterium]
CGLLFEGGEVDTFLVSKTLECPEEEVEELANGMGTISHEDARAMARYLMGRVDEIVRSSA